MGYKNFEEFTKLIRESPIGPVSTKVTCKVIDTRASIMKSSIEAKMNSQALGANLISLKDKTIEVVKNSKIIN